MVYKRLFEGKSIHNEVYYSVLDHILPINQINPVTSLNIKLVAFEDEADQVTNSHKEIVFLTSIIFKSANNRPMCTILLHIKGYPILYREEDIDLDGDQDSDNNKDTNKDKDKESVPNLLLQLIASTLITTALLPIPAQVVSSPDPLEGKDLPSRGDYKYC